MNGQPELIASLKQQSCNPNLHSQDTSPIGIVGEGGDRKRPSEVIEDAEIPPTASRPRLSTGQEIDIVEDKSREDVEDPDVGSLCDSLNDDSPSGSSESEFTSLGEDGPEDNETLSETEKRSGEQSVEISQKAGQDAAVRDVAGQLVVPNPATTLSAIPLSWDEACMADRTLVNMEKEGRSWHQTCQVWRQQTGQDTTPSALHYRHDQIIDLKDHTQWLKGGDEERLLAAVAEVEAKFRREKWQLVTSAMSRAGSAPYYKKFVRRQYKKLAGKPPKVSAAEDFSGRTLQPSTDNDIAPERPVAEVKGSSVTDSLEANLAQAFSPGERQKSSVGEEASHTNRMTTASPTSAAELTVEEQVKDSCDHEERPYTRIVAPMQGRIVSGNCGPPANPEVEAITPGSLPVNAISLDDSDTEPRADSTSSAPAKAKFAAAASHFRPSEAAANTHKKKGANNTAARSGHQSRTGSATNRGPAKFSSHYKAKDHSTSSKKDPVAGVPRNFQGLDISTSEAQRHNSHHDAFALPGKVDQQAAQQQAHSRELLQMHSKPQEQNSNSPSPLTVQHPLPFVAQAKTPHDLPHELFHPQKLLVHQKPLLTHSTQQGVSTGEELQARPSEASPNVTTSTIPSVTDASIRQRYSLGRGRPKKAVTKIQLKRMIRRKSKNEANRRKPWDVIAQECGVTASLTEISHALEQAGFPSILPTSTESSPLTVPLPPKEGDPPVSADASSSFMKKLPALDIPSTAAATPATPVRILATPDPSPTSQVEGTPRGHLKRGRGRPPKASSETPGQSTTLGREKRSSGQKTPNSSQSLAMKAAWARRKAMGTNGHRGGPPKSSAVGKSSVGHSASTFAAQILAAAAARTDVTASLAPQVANTNATGGPAESEADEPVDLLTGESMFAQHSENLPPTLVNGQRPAKKILAPCPENADLSIKTHPPKKYIRGPYRKGPIGDKPSRYKCQKCGKAYRHSQGILYHRRHHPDCANEPPRPDIRTDPPNLEDFKRISRPGRPFAREKLLTASGSQTAGN